MGRVARVFVRTESPTIPIAYPAASPVKPQHNPAAKWMKPLYKGYGLCGSTDRQSQKLQEISAFFV